MSLWLDFETRSRVDLGAKGVYNYAQDPSTEVLCMSYAFDDGEVVTWTPDQPFPPEVARHKGLIYAHNAAFERLIFWYVLQQNFDLEQFYCTATLARANCAPGSLEDVGRFASSSMKKDHRGAQLIRLLSIPQADGTFRKDEALMQEMIAYCEQDVRVMREISKAMRPLSAEELADYHVNERINDRGVLVDVDLAKAAMRYANDELIEIEERVAELTDGDITSVRSPKMREWVLERVGEQAKKVMWTGEKYSIDKTVRANLLAMENPDEVPPVVAEVIQCADDLWASSVAKFGRMADLADDEDRRVRGAFVFAGGSATGRASSYGLQVHNFTRKCAKEPDAVRNAMVRGHNIVPAYGKRVTDVLRGMLRPALMPAKGKHLVVADWSAIEGRVNPWLAASDFGEAKLDVFRKKLDPYKVNAAATYGVAYEAVDGEQRQVGKVQELACFAAETKVLTSNGVKAIVDVQLTDLLWDGQSWVTHQGVIDKGVRPTINVCGVQVTPDHLIKTKTTWTQAQELASNKQLLTQALEVGSAFLPYWETSALDKGLHGRAMRVFNAIAALRRTWSTFTTCLKARLPGATSAPKNLLVSGEKIFTSMPMPAQMTTTAGACSTGYLLARTDATTPRIEAIQTMAAGGYIYMHPGALTKPRSSAMLSRLMDGISHIWNSTVLMSTRITSRAIYGLLHGRSTDTTSAKSKTCNGTSSNLRPVYDILNSGSRNRFTVLSDAGPLIAHNCGFAGGVGAFAAMGRVYGVHFTETQARKTVEAWRRANPWSVRFWQQLEEAYTRAMRNRGHEFSAGRVTYMFDGLHLWYALPSGRVLCYPYARLESEGVTYAKASWKPAADAKEWPRSRLWKGLACENITQATANDILRHSLRQIDDVVLHVHDEIVVETDKPEELKQEMERIMCSPPAWAEGIPLAVEASIMNRYGK
jgi:DNA polymerase